MNETIQLLKQARKKQGITLKQLSEKSGVSLGTVNKLFGPTEGDKVVVFAATCLRQIGQKQRFLFAHLYSNLLFTQNSAPQNEGLRFYLSAHIKLGTLSPLSPGIYA